MQLISIQDYTQSILRSITSGVITVGPDGSVATVNLAAERMLGMTETEMVPEAGPASVPRRRRAGRRRGEGPRRPRRRGRCAR